MICRSETKIEFRKRNELWLGTGRKLGEKLFLIIENGKVVSLVFMNCLRRFRPE
jgi:hypothetical protein